MTLSSAAVKRFETFGEDIMLDQAMFWIETHVSFEALMLAGGIGALVALRRFNRRSRPQHLD
jgi:hypothetical protein